MSGCPEPVQTQITSGIESAREYAGRRIPFQAGSSRALPLARSLPPRSGRSSRESLRYAKQSRTERERGSKSERTSYNLFNTTNIDVSPIDAAVGTIDPTAAATKNCNFGVAGAALGSRTIQLQARFSF